MIIDSRESMVVRKKRSIHPVTVTVKNYCWRENLTNSVPLSSSRPMPCFIQCIQLCWFIWDNYKCRYCLFDTRRLLLAVLVFAIRVRFMANKMKSNTVSWVMTR